MATIPRALTIAGSDSGGGAGLQADLKTFSAFGVYGMSAVTAVTAQNTIGVAAIFAVSPEVIEAQITSVHDDIGIDATKIGMLGSAEVVLRVAACVRRLSLRNLVIDPVMVAKSGDSLLAEDARMALLAELLPLAQIVTPNLPEAAVLVGHAVESQAEMRDAARALHDCGARIVVVKGGHLSEAEEAADIVFDGTEFTALAAPRTKSKNTHGTGCTFSAAIAAGLAQGRSPLDAIALAKRYITSAIAEAIPLGSGHGPTNHLVGVSSIWRLGGAASE